MSRADGRVALPVDRFLYLEPTSTENAEILRAYLGAAGSSQTLRVDVPQDLSSAQRAQALSNLGLPLDATVAQLPLSIVLTGDITDGVSPIGAILCDIDESATSWSGVGQNELSCTVTQGSGTKKWVITIFTSDLYLGSWYTTQDETYPHLATTWIKEGGAVSGTPDLLSGNYVSRDAILAALDNLTTLVSRSDEGYSVSVANTLKSFNANTATVDDVIDVLATLIQTLKNKNVI